MYVTSFPSCRRREYSLTIVLSPGSFPRPITGPGAPGGFWCFMMIARAVLVVRKLRNVAAASGFLLFAVIPTSQPIEPVEGGLTPAFGPGSRKNPRFLPRALLFTSVSHGPSTL